MEINNNPKLWRDYYPVLKPRCFNCLTKGIGKEEYAFCSTERSPVLVYEENAWGRRGKLLTTLNDIYVCNTYHWTIYQGKNLKN